MDAVERGGDQKFDGHDNRQNRYRPLSNNFVCCSYLTIPVNVSTDP